MSSAVLECKDVFKQYELHSGPLEVLKGVSFELKEKELLAIVGISGSGKTTLLNLLFGIDNMSQGEIEIDGNQVSKMSKEDFRLFRRTKLGMIFQEFYLIPSMTAIENVMAPLIIAGKSEKLALTKAYRLLERVEMRPMSNKYPHQLSNGQKQRVAIARAIANSPKILICDEPTRALDTTLGDGIMDLLEELIEKEQISVIMTTHDPEVAARADRVLIIRNGILVEEKIVDKKAFDFRVAKEIYRNSEITDNETKEKPKTKKKAIKKKPKKSSKKS
ncbi:MAG: ABC transporter ATP-binding protein [Candidatus Heimdallarchaeota archaeon]|nr:ABC transporter ATP-binding protein [Candidatus Heimdallarchaeota archaeon]MBY8995285.1 ABC transporter ATP-binding protein [Candidatus Heimdallarchaeota archaeon]